MAIEQFLDGNGVVQVVSPSNPLPVTGGAAALPPDVTASGSLGALNATCTINAGPRDTLVIAVSGTFSGAISLQGSLDGTTWFTVNGPATWLNVATGAAATSVTTTGLWQSTISALPYVRVAMTAYTSGIATVVLDATDGNAMVALDAPLPSGLNLIGKVALADNSGNGIDRAASNTPAGPSNAAMVVTQSPNYVAAATGFGATLGNAVAANVVKTSAGSLMELSVWNPTGATVYVKLYAKGSAPAPASDVPIHVIPVAAGQAILAELGQYGKRFGSGGIAYGVTGGAADNDTTAPAAGVKISGTYL